MRALPAPHAPRSAMPHALLYVVSIRLVFFGGSTVRYNKGVLNGAMPFHFALPTT
jgi:hypothetical protein